MKDNTVLLLCGEEILQLFINKEYEILKTVAMAYGVHASGDTSLPYSTFLRFPDDSRNRIIALPAYLGGGNDAAGIKWIASFPDNLTLGLERASATLVLNSTQTGLPLAIMEGSVISTKRTAASAALAVQLLHDGEDYPSVGLVGCGLINFEILAFLASAHLGLSSVYLFDQDIRRAEQFKQKCLEKYNWLKIMIVMNQNELFENADIISFATTALNPYILELSRFKPGAVVLNISLRDLSPEIIMSAINIVDDIDHVCRAQTSVHLAEQQAGNRDFISCTIGEIILGKAAVRRDKNSIVIFSPFGLGILDIALAKLVFLLANEYNIGTPITDFIPKPWYERESKGYLF